MKEEKRSGLMFVCAIVKGAPNPSAYYEMIEQVLQRCCSTSYTKLEDGVFLVKPDECYPAIQSLISLSNALVLRAGEPSLRLLFADIADAPVYLSPDYSGAQSLIQETGRPVRLLKWPEEVKL